MNINLMIQYGKKIIIALLLIVTVIIYSDSFAAAGKGEPLLAEVAFKVNFVNPTADKPAVLKFTIAKGYYLYRDRISIQTQPKDKIDVALPKGEFKVDKQGNRVEIYKNTLTLTLPATIRDAEKLMVKFQGCSSEGFCYPPMQQSFTVQSNVIASIQNKVADTPLGTAVNKIANTESAAKALLKDQNGIASILSSQNYPIIILLFIGFGLLLAFTPCVLPMVPILTGIIIGQKEISTRKAFLLSCTYVLGTSLTYALAGVAAALMGNSLQVWLQKPAIILFVSLMFFILSLSLFGLFELRLPNRFHNRVINVSNAMQGGTFIGVFGMGMLSTLIVSPCVTAPLVGVLIYISQTGNMLLGAVALFALSIGMGIPLLLIGTTAGKWLPKAGPWMDVIKKIFGFIMLMMAIWLISRILSPQTADNLWKIFVIAIAFVVGGYLPRMIGYHRFHHSLAMLASISGVLLMMGGIHVPNPMTKDNVVRQEAQQTFHVVHNLKDLDTQLKLAQSLKKPVLLDFYADWCDSCIAMDKNVFAKDNVKQSLNSYVVLRADLTKNNEDDEAILKRFDVIAPPTILFFDVTGKEIDSQRIVGEIDDKEFLARLEESALHR